MVRDVDVSVPQAGWHETALKVLGMAATVLACAFAIASSIRVVNSPDVGYHLAYGEHFLDTGRIVQTNRWIWHPLDAHRLSDPNELGPGCSYDAATNTYSFVNANWLTQVVMAATYRAGGFAGLVALQVAIWTTIVILLVVAMRRGGVGWHWIGLPILVTFMACDVRIPLRPEVFGFLCLVAQWTLLLGPGFGPKRAAGVIALQVLAVNFHSYFLLGIVLTTAMAIDAAWQRHLAKHDKALAAEAAGRFKWVAVAGAGAILASLCNPWFVSGAIMPLQTVLFLKANHICDLSYDGPVHAWTVIREFVSPFSEKVRGDRTTTAYLCLALPAVAALILSFRRGRWGLALAMLAMLLTSLQMHRNIAPAALILAPVTMIILIAWLEERVAKLTDLRYQALARVAAVGVAVVTILLGAHYTVAVVTNRYYTSEHHPASFGMGASRLRLPLDAAEWIDAHNPPGNVYAEYGTTSNLMFFTHPHRDMPLLTNTWAMPPYLMLECAERDAGDMLPPDRRRPFEPFATENDVQTVVLSCHGGLLPLRKALANDPDWALVHIGPAEIVFLRKNGPAGALARANAISPKNLDVADYVRRAMVADLVPVDGLNSAAGVLRELGWNTQAIQVSRKAIEVDPQCGDSYTGLGLALAAVGQDKALAMQKFAVEGNMAGAATARAEAIRAWQNALEAFTKVVDLNGSDKNARIRADKVRQLLNRFTMAGAAKSTGAPRSPLLPR